MGFRNPVTSADAVDTGGGLIPGVKVYSDHGNPGSGIVEWDAYNAVLRAALTSSQTGSGGTFFDLGSPGTSGLPSIGLYNEPLQAGGYQNALHLNAKGGVFTFDDDTGWRGLPLLNGWTAVAEGARFRVRNNLCHFQVGLNRPGTWNGNAAQFPAGARPPYTHWFSGDFGSSHVEYKVLSSGVVVVSNDQNNANPSGVVASGVFPIN